MRPIIALIIVAIMFASALTSVGLLMFQAGMFD